FNGSCVDENKWKYTTTDGAKFTSVKDGILTITADWSPDKKRIRSTSLWTRQTFLYGYFEAKVRFRKESGWWSAFWLCTQSPSNPYMNGFEIDIYEDYFLSRKTANGSYGKTLDHNLHINAAGTLKSFNYNTTLPGSLDDYYVIGCKWTPFEISYYLNGKIMRSEARHSPYDSVTFDPFHHGNCIMPLSAILSGCCGRSGGDPKLGKFPDQFKVDYVRIYAYPREGAPSVTVKSDIGKDFILDSGTTLRFKVQCRAAKDSSIKAVYLMDSGFLLDYKTAPPYDFVLPLTKEYFDTTCFVNPGRNGQKPAFDGTLHAWSIMVQDSKGRVSHTKPQIRFVSVGNRRSTHYKGKAAVIPGTVYMGRYDEGGPGVAYHDANAENVFSKTYRKGEGVDVSSETGALGGVGAGEWLNFTVDVKESGLYTVKFHYGTPMEQKYPTYLISGKKIIGSFRTEKHKSSHWGIDSVAVIPALRLEKGRQTLKLFFLNGVLNASRMEFIPSGK
ncbi:MAG: family 16 glycosylhydrolase, partial [Lentisphaeria bacterium]|nr:family 16 glycosylhydrolase [Lentisphaeria bacterium]